MMLLLLAATFIALHLFVMPNGENGLLDVLHGHHADEAHGTALVWEGWEESQIESPTPSLFADDLPTATATLEEVVETVL